MDKEGIDQVTVHLDDERNEVVIKKKLCCIGHKLKQKLLNNLLFILTLAGVMLGFILGFGVREFHPSSSSLLWLGMPGDLYIRMLKSMIIPLIICSIISCAASLDPKSNGKISGVATTFIVSNNISGCVLAVLLCLIFNPGKDVHLYGDHQTTHRIDTEDIFADLLRNIFPSNVVGATFQKTQTINKPETSVIERNTTNGTQKEIITSFVKEMSKSDSPNILGLVVVCAVIGVAASTLEEKGKPFTNFFVSASNVVLKVLRWLLWYTPVGVMSLIAKSIASIEDVNTIFGQLGMFVATVTVGIIFQQIVFLPLVLFIITRRNPYLVFISILRPWMIAFASTSTAVAIPEMLHSCEVQNKVDQRVARFVIPLSVTIGATGSALYVTAAVIFLGNMSEFHFDFGSIMITVILTGAASMALPSVPSSSIVAIIMIVTSFGIPADGISFLFAVEWYLDRIRTSSNVVGHTFCAIVTHRICVSDLKRLDKANQDLESDDEQL